MKPDKDIENHQFSNLDAFQQIDVDADWKAVRRRIGFNSIKLRRFRWASAAAIVLLCAGFLAQQYLFAPEILAELAGEEPKNITLPDGSMVTLNKNSELTYPEKFSRGTRSLQLTGEAFFEVKSDSGRPFTVNVGTEAIVEVLGTSFNVKTSPGTGIVTVQVVEGRVSFSGIDTDSPSIVLNMNEQATLSDGMISMSEVVDINMYSWKTGILSFDQSPIGEVARHLETCYRIDIVLEDNVPGDLSFTSTIDNQELEEVLEELSLVLGLEFTIGNDKVVISKHN